MEVLIWESYAAQTLLSPKGVFYLVAVQQNKPDEIIEYMRTKGLEGEVRFLISTQEGKGALTPLRLGRSR